MKKSIIKIDEKSILKKQSFRLQTKEIFLTYPQCGDLELNFLRSELEKKLSTYTMKEFVLTREKHEDGGNHIHVFIITIKKTNIENERFFDIEKNRQWIFCGNWKHHMSNARFTQLINQNTAA